MFGKYGSTTAVCTFCRTIYKVYKIVMNRFVRNSVEKKRKLFSKQKTRSVATDRTKAIAMRCERACAIVQQASTPSVVSHPLRPFRSECSLFGVIVFQPLFFFLDRTYGRLSTRRPRLAEMESKTADDDVYEIR
jgi:hypothetical protein